jgi:hypothetical protein
MSHDFCCPSRGAPLRRPSRSVSLRCPRCRHGSKAPAAEAPDPDPRRFRRGLRGSGATVLAAALVALSVLSTAVWLVVPRR